MTRGPWEGIFALGVPRLLGAWAVPEGAMPGIGVDPELCYTLAHRRATIL